MFAPQVASFVDNWIILPGVLADGTAVDAWPVLQRQAYPTQDDVLAATAWNFDTAYMCNQSLNFDQRHPSAQWRVYSRHISRRRKDRKPAKKTLHPVPS